MDAHGSGDRADGPRSHTEHSRRFERAFAQLRVRRQAKVVVGGQINDGVVVERSVGFLFAIEYSESPVQALGFETVQLFGEIPQRISAHGGILRVEGEGGGGKVQATD